VRGGGLGGECTFYKQPGLYKATANIFEIARTLSPKE
jgi:hypothetical protein